MRSLLVSSIMIVGLLGGTSAVADDSMSLNQFPHRYEPVLLRVNAQGKVTDVSPAYSLSPKMTRLLNANLGEMIHAPATDKHGKPVSSQFVMNVALLAEPNGTGDYAAHFTYVSTRPVPPGNWYWVHLTGDRLALASQDMRFNNRRNYVPMERYRDGYRPAYKGSFSQPVPATTPAVQNAASSVSTPSSPPPSRTR
ncbi:hypothetical protein [Dyella agri]|uniref:Uncharacterized protein n=1 Tax=Dyella agri TaxID=1926869 RepID=A0ABW8KFK3_9GAMM